MKNYCKFLVLVSLCFIHLSVFGQEQKMDFYGQGPESANLVSKSIIAPNLFNGTVNLSIPLHELEIGDTKMPISIDYNSTGVRPDVHPGWIGSNWNLSAGGVITRKVKDLPDDYSNPNKKKEFTLDYPSNQIFEHSNTTTHYGNNLGYYFSHDLLSNYDKNLGYDYLTNSVQVYDTESDEFYFNFGNISGKFILNTNGTWQVVSASGIKISDNGFCDVPYKLSGQEFSYVWDYNGHYHTKTFKGFNITTSDGICYVFGSKINEASTDAIEYSIPMNNQFDDEWTAMSWFLTKIILPNGKEVTLSYESDSYICQMGVSFSYDATDNSICYRQNPRQSPAISTMEYYNSYLVDIYNQPSYILANDEGKYMDLKATLEYTNSLISPRYGSFSGTLIRPVYLSKVEDDLQIIEFKRTESTQLRYKSDIFTRVIKNIESRDKYTAENVRLYIKLAQQWYSQYFHDYSFDLFIFYYSQIFPSLANYTTMDDYWDTVEQYTQAALCNYPDYFWPYLRSAANSTNVNDMLNCLKWPKLDTIKITSKINNNDSYFYKFTYNNSNNERLSLGSVSKSSNDIETKYMFSYYEGSLPDYCREKVDHWGFLNNKNSFLTNYRDRDFHDRINQTLSYGDSKSSPYYLSRECANSIDIAKIGSLREIVYPTEGKKEFIYEMNKYNSVVNDNTLELDHLTGNETVGGLRIYQVKSYAQLNIPETITYYYTKNYSNNSDPLSLTSSGILSNLPKYFTQVGYKTNDLLATIASTKTIFSSQSFTPLSLNSNGNHICYSEVVEKRDDGSYTIYDYTNYLDYDGQNHYDHREDNASFSHFSPYIPATLKELERGKIKRIRYFNNENKPVKVKEYKYKSNSDNFSLAVNYKAAAGVCENVTAFYYSAVPYKHLLYNYELYSLEETTYDNSLNPVITTTDYNYNSFNQLTRSSVSKSDGNKQEALYTYPTDILFNTTTTNCVDYVNSINIGYTIRLNYCNSLYTDPTARKNCMISWWTQYPGACWDGSTGNYLSDACYSDCISNTTLPSLDSEASAIKSMTMQNIINTPIQVVTKNNTNITSVTYNKFLVENSIILPKVFNEIEISTPGISVAMPYVNTSGQLIKDGAFKEKVFYDSYDTKGNLLQYHEANNIYSAYIWGYNQTNPVVKAENIDYTTLNSAVTAVQTDLQGFLTNTIGDLTTDTQKSAWKLFNTSLRNTPTLSNALITTYTYKPLFGLTSQTDPNGKTTYYKYDTFGRLLFIKDDQGKILKKYDYHYSTQN